MRLIPVILFLILLPVITSSDDELTGIPTNFDAEYSKSDDYPYYTLDKVLSTFYDESKFNTKISTIGYISRDTSFPRVENQLLLQRIFVTCCIAHASPSTIYISTDINDKLPDGQWIKINGTVIGVKNKLGTSPCIVAEKLELIPQPDNPFLNCTSCPTEHGQH
ncbi:MAG: hypothetical protein WCZ17_01950 [Candidatus Kapaibacterium sp.]|nr:hypothetical protein [Candidatus Kapabacteria bacterium]